MSPPRGGAGKSDYLVQENEISALAHNANALFGCESLGLGVFAGETHEDFLNFGGG